ncbi:MAG: hypothetical protein HC822_09130 [Oscillochloris sp.]|nr:hypothetical protein [Oscillochloris sp.]
MMTQWSDADVMAAEEHMHDLVAEAHQEHLLREAHVAGNPPRLWLWLRNLFTRRTIQPTQDHQPKGTR